MRKNWWLATPMLAIAMVLPALAQQPNGPRGADNFFTGVNPRKINTVKVDPSKAMRGKNLGQALQSPVAQKRGANPFSLGSYFPRVTVASWPPKLPTFAKSQTPAFPKPTQVPVGNVKQFNQPPK